MAGMLLAGSVTALGARADDQSAFFDQQRQITDGYYPQYTAKDTSKSQTPESDAAEAMWFKHQMAKGTVDTYELNKGVGVGVGVAVLTQAAKESPATEAFETPIGEGSVATYTASEHAGNAN